MRHAFSPLNFAAVLIATVISFVALPALAAPSELVVTTPAKKQTYSAVITGLTPAASATDFFTITGSATKIIQVRSIGCTGTSTAAGALAVTAIERSAADTGGTSTAPAAVPLDSTDAAATAVVAAYTANPSALGTSVGAVASGLLMTIASASANMNGVGFTYHPDDVNQTPTLRGTGQILALNAGGASFTSGASLTCRVTWTEQ